MTLLRTDRAVQVLYPSASCRSSSHCPLAHRGISSPCTSCPICAQDGSSQAGAWTQNSLAWSHRDSSQGSSVGSSAGVSVGASVGTSVGSAVGSPVVASVGSVVGSSVGASVGSAAGSSVDVSVGSAAGSSVGASVGSAVGSSVGASVSTGVSSAASISATGRSVGDCTSARADTLSMQPASTSAIQRLIVMNIQPPARRASPRRCSMFPAEKTHGKRLCFPCA